MVADILFFFVLNPIKFHNFYDTELSVIIKIFGQLQRLDFMNKINFEKREIPFGGLIIGLLALLAFFNSAAQGKFPKSNQS